jgi:hypothetical protein
LPPSNISIDDPEMDIILDTVMAKKDTRSHNTTTFKTEAQRKKRPSNKISEKPTVENYRLVVKSEQQNLIALNPNSNDRKQSIVDDISKNFFLRGSVPDDQVIRECLIIVSDLGARPNEDENTNKNIIHWMPTFHLLLAFMKLCMKILQQIDTAGCSKIVHMFDRKGPYAQSALLEVKDSHKVRFFESLFFSF